MRTICVRAPYSVYLTIEQAVLRLGLAYKVVQGGVDRPHIVLVCFEDEEAVARVREHLGTPRGSRSGYREFLFTQWPGPPVNIVELGRMWGFAGVLSYDHMQDPDGILDVIRRAEEIIEGHGKV